MTISPEIAIITDELGAPFGEACTLVAALGLSTCELRNIDGRRISAAFSTEEIARIAATLRSLRIAAGSISPGLSKEHWSPGIRATDSFDHLGDLAEIADRLGCREIVCFGFRTKGQPAAPSLSWLADYFGALSARAKNLGVDLLLENHSSCAVATGDDLLAVADAVSSPHLKVVWDPANHYLRVRESVCLAAHCDALLPHLRAVHVKDIDASGVGCTLGQGEVGWASILGALDRANFQGRLTLEPHRRLGIEAARADLRELAATLEATRIGAA